MRRRDFLKAGAAGFLAALIFYEINKNQTVSDRFAQVDPEEVLEHSEIRPQDKKMLEDFLVQLNKDQEPDYTLQDLEKNMLVVENGESQFNATLINNEGYFFTANHFPFPWRPFDQCNVVTTQGEKHNIERIVLAYSIFYYDFLIGKIPAVKNLEIKPLIYTSDIRIGGDVQAVPSPIHPYRRKISGKIIEPYPKRTVGRGKLYSSLDTEGGHSGSLIVNPELKVLGIVQGQLGILPEHKARDPLYFPCYGLNVECMKELIECALQTPNA